MSAKAYVFAVWAPEGDDCPPAGAAVAASSLNAARTALRRAGVKLVDKEPLSVLQDPDALEDLPTDEVVWRYADPKDWQPD